MRPSIWAVWSWWTVTPLVADRVGDQRKGLDFALEDPDGGRPAVIDRQAELGPEVDDLAARGKDREPARLGGHARGQRSVTQPGRACRNELEAGGPLEDHPRTPVELDLGQPSFQPQELAGPHVAAWLLVLARPPAVLGVDQPGDIDRAMP